MKKNEILLALVSFFLFSAGIALYLTLYFQSSHFSILNHSLSFNPLIFTLFLLAVYLLSVLAWLLLAGWEARFFDVNKSSCLWQGFLASWPLSFFLLTPLCLQHYLNREDLRARLKFLAIAVLLATIYLKFIEWNRIGKRKFYFLEKWEARFFGLSLKKKLVILFLVAFFIYNLCTFLLVSHGITFSGDEPNYLLTTHSLLRDKDINLANNYAREDYFSFYSREEHPRLRLDVYGQYGRKGENYIYPINLPGISVLMLPYYWMSQNFKGKILTFILKGSLSIWAVLLGLQLYLFTRERWQRERLSLALWFLYSFSTPVLFYAIHLYPEIPLALLSFYIWRKISSPAHLSLFHYFFLGFFLSTFFWFGLKYNFIFWPLLGVSVFFLLKTHKARGRIFFFLVFPLLSFFLFYYFIYSLYGTLSPISVYEGIMTPEKTEAFKAAVLELPFLSRIESFFDYFLDQRDGLLLYSPFYLFTFLGFIEIFRRTKRDFAFLLLISLPFLFNYAFFTHRQGYSPQARILTPLSWMGAIGIGYFLAYNQKKLYSFLFWFSGLTSLAVAFILLRNPMFLYQPTTHEYTSRAGDFFISLSNLHFFLPPFLPSFIKVKNTGYLPNYFWILAIGAFILFYIFLKGKIFHKRAFHFSFIFLLLGSLFYLRALYPRTVPYPSRTVTYSSHKAMGFYFFPMREGIVLKNRGELYLHKEKSYKILFSSKTKLEKIKLTFGSEKGEYEIRISFFDLPISSEKTKFENKEIVLSPQAFYRLRNLFLYEINLELKKYSTESMIVDPYLFQIFLLKD